MKKGIAVLIAVVAALSFAAPGSARAADQTLKPYLLGSQGAGTIAAKLPEVKAALEHNGFKIVGEYAPYPGAEVVVATSDALQAAAAKTKFGVYGAIVRVSLTEAGKDLQVAATNPRYFAAAYRMDGDLGAVADALAKAIGGATPFGSKDGFTAKELRKYHYMIMMPYFDDGVKLASYPTQTEALKTIEANLAAKKGGSAKVYRVDLQGKDASVIGVAITKGEGADATIMKVIDQGELKHTAHLPYEIAVVDGTVWMLHGKFRIALDFPDLGMGTFMKISGAPSAIEDVLSAVAGKGK